MLVEYINNTWDYLVRKSGHDCEDFLQEPVTRIHIVNVRRSSTHGVLKEKMKFCDT